MNVSAARPMLTYIGIGVTAIGFAVIAYAWGRVAGLDTVALQMPYLLSGGLTGLGFVLVGLTIVNVAALRAADATRQQQADRLDTVLHELREGRP